MIKSNILFDSSKHTRKIPSTLEILVNDSPVYSKSILFNRIIMWETEYCNRLNLFLTNSESVQALEEVFSEYSKKLRTHSADAYMRFTMFPNENDKNERIITFISSINVDYLDNWETICEEKIFLSYCDKEFYVIKNGEKIKNQRYEDLVPFLPYNQLFL
jgi:hypothetical protein